MSFIGWGILLIFLPFVILLVLFSLVMPFISDSLKAIKKETKNKLDEENNNIIDLLEGDNRELSLEEQKALCKRFGNIVADGRKKVRSAVDKEFGIDDMKQGHKEIMNELKTNDLRDFFK